MAAHRTLDLRRGLLLAIKRSLPAISPSQRLEFQILNDVETTIVVRVSTSDAERTYRVSLQEIRR